MSTTTFSVGDRVRVKAYKDINIRLVAPGWWAAMRVYCETEFIVEDVSNLGNMKSSNFYWHPSWLELVEPETPINLYL